MIDVDAVQQILHSIHRISAPHLIVISIGMCQSKLAFDVSVYLTECVRLRNFGHGIPVQMQYLIAFLLFIQNNQCKKVCLFCILPFFRTVFFLIDPHYQYGFQ